MLPHCASKAVHLTQTIKHMTINNTPKIMQSIQTELKAPKGRTNKFGGYSYRSAEDILEALKPLLSKYNCFLTISDEIVEVGGRVYVKATATLHESHSDTIAETTAYAREAENKKGMDQYTAPRRLTSEVQPISAELRPELCRYLCTQVCAQRTSLHRRHQGCRCNKHSREG